VTVTTVEPATALSVAVRVALPGALPVTSPEALTAATTVLDDVQVAELDTSSVEESE
jgi:hypothetical protein